ncbi:response regulator [Nostoc sp. TCL26-01]|uniref:response regulator n=1 Tax=Nostoc sp. TCL26-01 TaxID=2576904 RepID=UPI0015B92FFC|nr:response regulator [Nostoc sp. TCL26-01]QLE58800.1 response regulator [Nostoc sp. TCL26-01]
MTANLLTRYQQFHSCPLKRILLVEDNDINRMLLSDYLSYCGYYVKSLSDGSDFLMTVEKFRPELILLDLKLPDVDGYSLLQQMQQHPDFSNIPVIVVSALAFKADQERAITLGVRSYFVKPVNLNSLIMKIEEVITCNS